MTLYDIGTDFFALKALMEEASFDAEGNLKAMDDETRKVLDDMADQWKGEFTAKAERICKFRANVLSDMEDCVNQAKQFEAEAKRLKAAAETHARKIVSLDYTVMRVMSLLNLKKLPAVTFTISVVKNPPALDVLDQAEVPAEYFDEVPATVKLNNARLKEALKDTKIPGARLIQGERLAVK